MVDYRYIYINIYRSEVKVLVTGFILYYKLFHDLSQSILRYKKSEVIRYYMYNKQELMTYRVKFL